MSTRVRILSIVPYQIFPAKLGGEKGIAVFNEYLAKQADVAAVTIKANKPEYARYPVYNIIANGRWRYGNIFLYFTIRKFLRNHNASHLIIEHPYYGWLAWMIKKTTRVKWIVHSHNMEYMRSQSIGRWWWKPLKRYESWVYRNADLVFYISEDDLKHAVANLGVSENRSMVVTYGIEQNELPHDFIEAKEHIRQKHSIPPDHQILLFNGALYHSTNYDALRIILDEINPHLLSNTVFKYKIVVCGRGLPHFFNELQEYRDKNIIYAGFVDDISVYFKAADVFLNPILSGGGVKTKAIEALSMNCSVVSTPLGALGLKKEVCGSKLTIVNEGEWKKFSDEVISATQTRTNIPQDFFEYYSWTGIIKRVISRLINDIA